MSVDGISVYSSASSPRTFLLVETSVHPISELQRKLSRKEHLGKFTLFPSITVLLKYPVLQCTETKKARLHFINCRFSYSQNSPKYVLMKVLREDRYDLCKKILDFEKICQDMSSLENVF